MSQLKSDSLKQAERNVRLLWASAFVLILVLSATVFMLGVTHQTLQGLAKNVHAGIGLIGLTAIFVLYTIVKHSELNRVKQTLDLEEKKFVSLHTRLGEVCTLFQIATSLNLGLRVNTILDILVQRVVYALKAQQASVMLYDPEKDTLRTRASYGVESEYTSQGEVRMGDGVAGVVARQGRAVLLNNDLADIGLEKHRKQHRNITSAICVPLKVENRCIGVLNVNRINYPEPFTPRQKDILNLFAEQIATVIERGKAMEDSDRQATELKVTNSQLKDINKMKDVFLATASHELKTPLTSIIGYAELLNDHEDQIDSEDRREFTQRLRLQAVQLMELIEDVLDLTRLETGKITLNRKRVDLNDVTKSAVDTVGSLAAQKGVRIVDGSSKQPQAVVLDEVKIRQALVNLLVNAINFSPEDGEVLVQTRDEEESVVLEVSDQGPGVSDHDSSKIFTLFGQGVRERHKTPTGLGIGLHLVQRIVELHGGQVGVTPRNDGGSVFWVKLPKDLRTTNDEAA